MSDAEDQDTGAPPAADVATDVMDAPGTAVEPAGTASHAVAHFDPASLPMLPGELRPHPTPFQYVIVAVVLVVLTAIEVGLYYLEGDLSENLIIALLLILMVVKFFLVASWYMHLRTDRKIFSRFFAVGAIGAILLYTVMLLTLHVFD